MAKNGPPYTTDKGRTSWGFPGLKNIFMSLPVPLKEELVETTLKSNEQTILHINGLVMPHVLTLLENFHPRQWADEIEQTQVENGVGIQFRAVNMLWAQVVLLDVAIRLLVKALERFLAETPSSSSQDLSRILTCDFMWGEEEASVIAALIDHSASQPLSASDPVRPSYTTWDFTDAVRERCEFSAEGSFRESRAQQISDLLILRALVFIAFLILNPDTTDVCLAQGSKVEMPMI
jgi:hypothetical protein